MNIFHVLILGIVEGITEFLPISSTGHLIMASRILNLPQTDFIKSFDIIIQLGAILAVIVLYWESLVLNKKILRKVLAAFIPTCIVGLMAYNFIKNVLMESYLVVAWSLLIGGIILVIFEKFYKKKEFICQVADISYFHVLLIGLFQSIAIIPGVSRSAATIIGGLILGLERKTIVEFSFLLAVPTMLAATGLDLLQNYHLFSSDQFLFLCLGFLVSFFVAIGSIKFLLYFIKTHDFISFGIYRIVISIIFLAMLAHSL